MSNLDASNRELPDQSSLSPKFTKPVLIGNHCVMMCSFSTRMERSLSCLMLGQLRSQCWLSLSETRIVTKEFALWTDGRRGLVKLIQPRSLKGSGGTILFKCSSLQPHRLTIDDDEQEPIFIHGTYLHKKRLQVLVQDEVKIMWGNAYGIGAPW